ncbi:MAG: carboxynorspermidine decarboxylase [Candidatus Electrothrix aestuarii]|uniref:Carboxynorspermidine/carboxyspermidine decarboxylase n=1 Tax=Candidatus Electrothrix aestuarii TaxID=3062594 RepID=A0AAU8LRK4_9BACT|nr:carboxynorspermidine decarboxylase [Candidatus Electrothrix aestuarii]
MKLATPYYLIDEARILENLERIQSVREQAGVRSVLALKCFSTWPVFGLMRQYMDGTTSSSLYEARLGYEEFGKEVHAYSVAFTEEEIDELCTISDKIIFNSVSQLQQFAQKTEHLARGLRLNPQVSYSHFDLANPARQYSRLGFIDVPSLEIRELISGAMLHYNCENADFENFSLLLDQIGERYKDLLYHLDWLSLGGGLYFTRDDYPLEKFIQKLKAFSEQFELQLYLEPGEAAITGSTSLVTTVLDIVHNERDIAIVDSSIEAHMLDLLIYQEPAQIKNSLKDGEFHYFIAGKSCLAGDVFGEYRSDAPLQPGDQVQIADAGGYTMVKMNWFNGLKMPSIMIKRLDGRCETVKTFSYQDFKENFGTNAFALNSGCG